MTWEPSRERQEQIIINGWRHHRWVLIRVSSSKDGKWFANCDHPFDLQSEEYNSVEEAIAELEELIDNKLDEEIKPLTEEELEAYETSVACWDCWGTGKIYTDSANPSKCSTCKGTGYV